jgi:hypothetical protein
LAFCGGRKAAAAGEELVVSRYDIGQGWDGDVPRMMADLPAWRLSTSCRTTSSCDRVSRRGGGCLLVPLDKALMRHRKVASVAIEKGGYQA